MIKEIAEQEQQSFVGGNGKADSPGFNIGGKDKSYETWLSDMGSRLEGSGVPDSNPGKSTRVNENSVYPGGLNSDTFFSLLDSNPNFTTPIN